MLLFHQNNGRTAWADEVGLSRGLFRQCGHGVVLEPGAGRELLDRTRWRTRVELANAIFDYLEIFHNRQRRHSSLGMLTPVEFEARNRPTTAA